MELCINASNLLGRYELEKCVDIYRTAGFTSMDYSLGDLINADNVLNGEGYVAEAQRIRRTAEGGGLPITQTHTPFRFTAEQWNTRFEEFVFPTLVRSLEVSALLGAKIAVVHPLHHMVFHGHEEEIFALNMDFYRRLIPYCKEYDIKVGIENMWQTDKQRKCIVHDTCSVKEEFVRYIDTLDSEYTVGCLDIGHVSLPYQDDTAADVIRALGHDRLKALHVHDNDYRSDAHVIPYMGALDWAEIARALGEIDYEGDFTYEIKAMYLAHCDEGFIPLGARFMADVGKHIMGMIDGARGK